MPTEKESTATGDFAPQEQPSPALQIQVHPLPEQLQLHAVPLLVEPEQSHFGRIGAADSRTGNIVMTSITRSCRLITNPPKSKVYLPKR